MIMWLLVFQLWNSLAVPNDTRVILNGVWQSCRETEGGYAERIYEYRILGKYQWEFHMGPYHEFGLYRQPQPDDHQHDTPSNLLKPDYHIIPHVWNSNLIDNDWNVPTLKLTVSAHAAGGSLDDCETVIIRITKVE